MAEVLVALVVGLVVAVFIRAAADAQDKRIRDNIAASQGAEIDYEAALHAEIAKVRHTSSPARVRAHFEKAMNQIETLRPQMGDPTADHLLELAKADLVGMLEQSTLRSVDVLVASGEHEKAIKALKSLRAYANGDNAKLANIEERIRGLEIAKFHGRS